MDNFCGDQNLLRIIGLLKAVIRLIQILIPIGLIVLGTIDLGKAVIGQKDDELDKARKAFIRRCLAAVVVFLVVTIVQFVMGFVGSDEWQNCWNNAIEESSGQNNAEE